MYFSVLLRSQACRSHLSHPPQLATKSPARRCKKPTAQVAPLGTIGLHHGGAVSNERKASGKRAGRVGEAHAGVRDGAQAEGAMRCSHPVSPVSFSVSDATTPRIVMESAGKGAANPTRRPRMNSAGPAASPAGRPRMDSAGGTTAASDGAPTPTTTGGCESCASRASCRQQRRSSCSLNPPCRG